MACPVDVNSHQECNKSSSYSLCWSVLLPPARDNVSLADMRLTCAAAWVICSVLEPRGGVPFTKICRNAHDLVELESIGCRVHSSRAKRAPRAVGDSSQVPSIQFSQASFRFPVSSTMQYITSCFWPLQGMVHDICGRSMAFQHPPSTCS
jgi:hypothetical protein